MLRVLNSGCAFERQQVVGTRPQRLPECLESLAAAREAVQRYAAHREQAAIARMCLEKSIGVCATNFLSNCRVRRHVYCGGQRQPGRARSGMPPQVPTKGWNGRNGDDAKPCTSSLRLTPLYMIASAKSHPARPRLDSRKQNGRTGSAPGAGRQGPPFLCAC